MKFRRRDQWERVEILVVRFSKIKGPLARQLLRILPTLLLLAAIGLVLENCINTYGLQAAASHALKAARTSVSATRNDLHQVTLEVTGLDNILAEAQNNETAAEAASTSQQAAAAAVAMQLQTEESEYRQCLQAAYSQAADAILQTLGALPTSGQATFPSPCPTDNLPQGLVTEIQQQEAGTS